MPSSSDSLRAQLNSNPTIISGITRPAGSASADGVDGVDLDGLPIGAVLEVQTGHNVYRLENRGDGSMLMSGHPKYCPEPTVVQIQGSLGDAGELKWRYLGRGMKMAFLPPDHGIVRTSEIRS